MQEDPCSGATRSSNQSQSVPDELRVGEGRGAGVSSGGRIMNCEGGRVNIDMGELTSWSRERL